jgi:hypothetical protein
MSNPAAPNPPQGVPHPKQPGQPGIVSDPDTPRPNPPKPDTPGVRPDEPKPVSKPSQSAPPIPPSGIFDGDDVVTDGGGITG